MLEIKAEFSSFKILKNDEKFQLKTAAFFLRKLTYVFEKAQNKVIVNLIMYTNLKKLTIIQCSNKF